jgi:uncharacterized membrane protein YoaK (UPF0700 family)
MLLTLIAGMVDAVAFLGLEQVFAANMTGNVVLLGLGIAGAPTLSIDGPAVALAAFLLGAALVGRVEHRGRSRHYYVVRLVRIELVVVAIAALLAIGFEADDDARRLLIIAILATMMGGRNESIRRIDLPELRTTVLTLAIAGFAAHEAEGTRSRRDWLRFGGILAMVVGAIASALLVLNTDVIWALLAIVTVEAGALLALRGRATAHADTVGR